MVNTIWFRVDLIRFLCVRGKILLTTRYVHTSHCCPGWLIHSQTLFWRGQQAILVKSSCWNVSIIYDFNYFWDMNRNFWDIIRVKVIGQTWRTPDINIYSSWLTLRSNILSNKIWIVITLFRLIQAPDRIEFMFEYSISIKWYNYNLSKKYK